jgi:hypothetical protein
MHSANAHGCSTNLSGLKTVRQFLAKRHNFGEFAEALLLQRSDCVRGILHIVFGRKLDLGAREKEGNEEENTARALICESPGSLWLG